MSGTEKVLDPFSPVKAQTTRQSESTNDQNQESESQRRAERQAILDRRAERRKSMANRRVSFAPEATLHTWSVMELGEDSTASSASNSTRRQSSMTAQSSPRHQSSSPAKNTPTDRPITPPEQLDEPQVAASPAHQRDLHQKKRRRSSTAPADQVEDEVLSSSPSGDFQTDSSPVRIDDSVGSDSDDTDGDTAMSMDEATSQSIGTEESTGTQTSLDERLRHAANLAGTRGIEYDEYGDDMSMEMATSTVTNAFQPWVIKDKNAPENVAMGDQENLQPVHSDLKANTDLQYDQTIQDNDTQDLSMDVTHAVGGILREQQSSQKRRKSVANRRRSSMPRRRSSGAASVDDDESMDFTSVDGGILSKRQDDIDDEDMSDEDMTMEFTNVVGGVLNGHTRETPAQPSTDAGEDTMELTGNMDVTTAYGGILPPIEEQTEPQTDVGDNQTVGMDMTRAIGGIVTNDEDGEETTQMDMTKAVGGIVPTLSSPAKSVRKQLMQEEAGTPKAPADVQGFVSSIASETGSPDVTLKPRLSGRSRQTAKPVSTTPKFSPRRPSPAKSSPSKAAKSTPTKQMTPLPARAETPNKTPVNATVTQRTASPKKLFQQEIKNRKSPPSTSKTAALFAQNEHTGQQTPSVVLKANRPQPVRRRSSGVGIDQHGFGSPQVAQMLDRRSSIGDAAPSFQLNGKARGQLRFEDPQELERELDAERAEEERRESGRFIMEQEANVQQEENVTMQLKEMIESMTPKKDKSSRLKGRKSLAVGGARGLLGKRPAELDLEEEDSPSSPKRLRAFEREGSPVKKVHLPKPPSKEETTGRLTRAEQLRLREMSTRGSTTPATSPPKKSATSPNAGGRYRDVPLDQSSGRPESFVDKLDNVVGAIDMSVEHGDESEQDKISLQDFLNMTNIHFIELSTTKRRHTQAPAPQRPSQESLDKSTEAQFVAAATTLPLLELYQHATRELKSYISTGRKIIRSIESETFNEQPALFREYVDARPDIKAVMDNQFRNGKTNARLQSKEGWYSWRAQLVDGLKTGLDGIKQGMLADWAVLETQQQQLNAEVPDLSQQQEALTKELETLQQTLEELDSVDTAALDQTRRELRTADAEVTRKAALLESLKQQMLEKEDALGSAEELKTELGAQIEEADRVRHEYRGWPVADVLALKSRVEAIEKESGWKLVAAEEDTEEPNDFGVALTMTYKNQLRLFFYPAVFQAAQGSGRRRSGRKSKSVSGPSAPISLVYAPTDYNGELLPSQEPSTEKRFFLQLIRSQLHAYSMMPKGSVAPKTLLDTVSNGWQLAQQVSEEVRLLNMTGVTMVQILGDEKLGIRTKLILPERSRVDIDFNLTVGIFNDGGISSSTNVTAEAIYGPKANLIHGSKGRKVQTALTKEAQSKDLGDGSWLGAIHAFEQWVEAQIEKKQEMAQSANIEAVTAAPPPPQAASIAASPATNQPDNTASTQIVPPTTTRDLRRSPLAPKSKNTPAPPPQQTQKKQLPVPSSKRFTLANTKIPQLDGHTASAMTVAAGGKENALPAPVKSVVAAMATVGTPTKQTLSREEVAELGTPAIPPEMQEQMMNFGSPFRRRGALRRSPV